MALLFSDSIIMEDIKVHSDADDSDPTRPHAGRFLAIEATLSSCFNQLMQSSTQMAGQRQQRRMQMRKS